MSGSWGKTHRAARILCELRLMFVLERDGGLVLAPFVPEHYFRDGQEIVIENAPTPFGPVSYALHSHVDDGYVEAPARARTPSLSMRVRHPQGRPMTAVEIDHEAWPEFAVEDGLIRLPDRREMHLRVQF